MKAPLTDEELRALKAVSKNRGFNQVVLGAMFRRGLLNKNSAWVRGGSLLEEHFTLSPFGEEVLSENQNRCVAEGCGCPSCETRTGVSA